MSRYGANPDLRDEDGKTPLDKARERNDEGHREVAQILQSPADFIPSTQEETPEDQQQSPPQDQQVSHSMIISKSNFVTLDYGFEKY